MIENRDEDGDWIEITSLDQLRAIGRRALAEGRAETHANVDRLFEKLETEGMTNLEGEPEAVRDQLKAFGRRMLDEQRTAALAKVDSFFDDLEVENMARLGAAERHILGASLH